MVALMTPSVPTVPSPSISQEAMTTATPSPHSLMARSWLLVELGTMSHSSDSSVTVTRQLLQPTRLQSTLCLPHRPQLVNQPLAFTAYRGNLISISDADSGANAVEVTLTADTGTITLLNPDPSGRLTYLAGDGTEDATMTFTGTVADINTALEWVSFRPEADYLGDATITITTDDLGNVGLGGAQVGYRYHHSYIRSSACLCSKPNTPNAAISTRYLT